MNLEIARNQMLGQQIRTWDVLDPRVLDVLREVPRETFVEPRYARLAFADTQLPLPHGETMMAPLVEGRMLQSLDIEPDDSILEIGTGSGFVTACLSRLGGRVHSLELHTDLAKSATERLASGGFTGIEIDNADAASLDAPGRYDVIAVTGSVESVPGAFKDALKVGGRLFVIAGTGPVMEAFRIERIAGDQWRERSLFETWLPPLHNVGAVNLFDW